MGPEASLEKSRDRRPQESTEHPEGESDRDVEDARQSLEVVAREHAEDRAQVELALGPDVEEAGAEPERHRQAEEDVRDRRHERLAKRPVVGEGALEQGGERRDRIVAGEQDRDPGDDETARDRQHREDDRFEKPSPQRPVELHAAPAINSPIRSRSASFWSNVATTRPR